MTASTEVRTRTVSTNGVDLFVTEAGPEDGPVVVLAHGFPELSFSWRHQLPALAEAGYRAIAPDMRGYGRSTQPEAQDDYDIVHLTGDVIGLLDDAGAEQAVVVGHDWGSIVAWNTAILAPERLRGVVGMSVPFLPRGPMPPTQLMQAVFGGSFFYILYFQEPGVAEADLGRDAATTMRRMLAGMGSGNGDPDAMAKDERGFVERLADCDELPSWLTQDELDHYVTEFARTGFRGGVSWYRNLDRNWSIMEPHAEDKVTIPSLFLTGAQDPVNMMSPSTVMDGWLDDHRGSIVVRDAGHWVQQEKPDEVNAALLDFLRSLDG
jgi:pimeloyl-ACP methyl ester carboxylesterase